MTVGIAVEQIFQMYGDCEPMELTGYFARGHFNPTDFLLAVRQDADDSGRFDDLDAVVDQGRVRHEYWVDVPIADYRSAEGLDYPDEDDGLADYQTCSIFTKRVDAIRYGASVRDSYPVTVLSLE